MTKFLLDANFFITAYRQHYPMDVFPSYWTKIERLAQLGLVFSIDKVRGEICDNRTDALSAWMTNSLSSPFFLDSTTVLSEYTQVANWAYSRKGHYSTPALNEFLDANEADAWLVAHALKTGYTITSYETSNPVMIRKVKIPEPCDALGVHYIEPVAMFRTLGETF